MEPHTIFAVDADAETREFLVQLAGRHGVPAEAYATGEEFLRHHETSARGAIVAELRLAGVSGVDFLAVLRERDVPLPVIFLTAHADVPTAVKAMQNGAHTVLQKPCPDGTLWQAVEAALAMERKQRGAWRARYQIRTRLAALTDGERAVMRRLLAGKPNKRIASALGIGLRTVELRRARLLKKMQAGSLAELVRMATRVDFLPYTEGGS